MTNIINYYRDFVTEYCESHFIDSRHSIYTSLWLIHQNIKNTKNVIITNKYKVGGREIIVSSVGRNKFKLTGDHDVLFKNVMRMTLKHVHSLAIFMIDTPNIPNWNKDHMMSILLYILDQDKINITWYDKMIPITHVIRCVINHTRNTHKSITCQDTNIGVTTMIIYIKLQELLRAIDKIKGACIFALSLIESLKM